MQRIRGWFLNRGLAGEEVVQDDLKGIMTSGDKEQEIRELLRLTLWLVIDTRSTQLCIPQLLMIFVLRV